MSTEAVQVNNFSPNCSVKTEAQDVPPGYKWTEVGLIPADWVVKVIGDLSILYQPVTISDRQLTESGNPVYGANGLIGFYSQFNHETWQVIVTCRGSTCGTVNRTVDRSWITGNAMVLNCDQNRSVDKEFFFYLISAQDLSVCITGTGQPQIVRSPLAAYPVGFPPRIAEQRAIAKALSDVDGLLAALDKLIAKKRAIKKGAMQQLLTGKTRLPGFSGEWETKRLGKFVSIRNQKVMPSQCDPATPCVELEHIGHGDGRLLSLSTAAHSTSSKYRFCAGDVLFGRLRSYLRKHWISEFNGICTTEIWPLVVDPRQANSGFLLGIVQTDRFIETASIAYGTHMPRADWSVMRNFEVDVPSVDEQAAIATVLSAMDAEIATMGKRREKIRAIKQGMMQQLLTGRVRLV